jgi:23S rRNA pseudouridine1911/1915/1917 synthase
MGVSGRMLQRLTRSRGIRLNGGRTHLERKVRSGDVVAVRTADDHQPATLPPVPMELEIVYEDADLLIINKPAGLLVHPTSPRHGRTLAHGLAHLYATRGTPMPVRPVHRLDRDTSGLLLVARSSFSHQQLDRQLREGVIEREYLAIAHGVVEAEEGTIDAPIARSRSSRMLRAVAPDGQSARTHYVVHGRSADFSVLGIRLETGRTHQIRVHLAHAGHPIVGDRQYGGLSGPGGIRRPALHAWKLRLLQPRSGEELRFQAAPPEDIQDLLDRMEVPVGSGEADEHALQEDDREESDDGGEIDSPAER